MALRIAFDPGLGLDADEFVAAWNESELVAEGAAVIDEAPAETFLPLEITVALISAAVAIPGTVIATFISDYLKKKFIDGEKPQVIVTTYNTPEGTPLLVVTQEVQE